MRLCYIAANLLAAATVQATTPSITNPKPNSNRNPPSMPAAATTSISIADNNNNNNNNNIDVWHVVWTGGQSNSVGTNSQKNGYPTWPTSPRIQMYCWRGSASTLASAVSASTSAATTKNDNNSVGSSGAGAIGGCANNTFAPASVPLYGENNVGFSQTYANLLLRTLPNNHGVITVNTGVGGTGFSDGRWVVPDGPLLVNSVKAIESLARAVPTQFNGSSYHLHTLLWHQGEEDAGDNRQNFHASYCQYLEQDLSALIDYLRTTLPGAGPGTPFLAGNMLPYWVDAVNGTSGVHDAIASLNSSRSCTGTASPPFPDFFPGTNTPCGEPGHRSGITGDVIHFNATQAVVMGYQYWNAYLRALKLSLPVKSSRTAACGGRFVEDNGGLDIKPRQSKYQKSRKNLQQDSTESPDQEEHEVPGGAVQCG